MTEVQQILHALRQTSNPVGPALIRRIIGLLERIEMQETKCSGYSAKVERGSRDDRRK